MQIQKYHLDKYISMILNKRAYLNQGTSNSNILNYTQNSKTNDQNIAISIYLEHVTDHRKILAEQWILCLKNYQVTNQQCGKFCQLENFSLCCLLTKSPLYQNFIVKQSSLKNYQLQIIIDHNGKNQNLELYKCYHLNMQQNLGIIARFHQHLNLTQEINKQRSLSFQEQTVIPKQNNKLTRFNSEQIQTPEKKVFMYFFEEDVTFLIDETQVERVMSQNSDSDFMIQTIDDETDVTEWQVIDHKQLLSKNQKKMLDDLKQIRDHFNFKSKHSHQIQMTIGFIQQ
ncbi:unnamed protein product [Paramecium primaurelia]|uniref:Uncharacterized protein n=1 Tax=Paramecium primaurelia TaxID=5886 RepID=A0A8S1QBQ6_PARPR|nr:unnamed protein product [Paramecium primaurelia]